MHKMLSMAAVLATTLTLGACSMTERAATVGAVTGATIGGLTTGTVLGAATGAAVGGIGGAVAGELLGRWDRDPNRCVWEDRSGRRYLDDCAPNG